MERKKSLVVRFVVGFLCLGIWICSVTTAQGYEQYKSYIQKKYNDTAYDIAEICRGYMTEEELALYLHTAEEYTKGNITLEELNEVKSLDSYIRMEKLLENLRSATEANDIYITYSDKTDIAEYDSANAENWKPITYVFDCYMDEALKFEFGHRGAFNPEFIAPVLEIMETGERVDNYFISKGEFGYNTSAIYPLYVDGEVKGVIGVEIPMSTLQHALQEYIVNAVMVTAVVVIVFILLFMLYMYKKMISPINLIAKEAEKFVENNTEFSEKLKSIKTKDEIQMLSESILKMEIGIKEYIENLTRITAEKEKIGAELNVATQIQADMLPSIFPAFPDRNEFDIFATMEPAKEVGGDFYDFFMVDEDHLVFTIADVSGKGVPAALFMVISKTLLKNQLLQGGNPKKVLEEVNNQLCENNKEGMFVTAWIGILELSTGKLVYANAGHNMPVLKRKDGEFEYLRCKPGFVLAGFEDIPYTLEEIQIFKGDKIYLYTDGVTESIDTTQEQFGEERLQAVLNENKDEKPEDILRAVKEKMDVFVGEAEQFDDITMLCVHYKE